MSSSTSPYDALESYLESLHRYTTEAASQGDNKGIDETVQTAFLRHVSLEPLSLPAFLIDVELFLASRRAANIDDASAAEQHNPPAPAPAPSIRTTTAIIFRALVERGNRKETWMALSEQLVRLRELAEEVDEEAGEDEIQELDVQDTESNAKESTRSAEDLAAELERWHHAIIDAMNKHRDSLGVGVSSKQYAAAWRFLLDAYRIYLTSSAGFPFRNPLPHLNDLVEQLGNSLNCLQQAEDQYGLRLDDEFRAGVLVGIWRVADACWRIGQDHQSSDEHEDKLTNALVGLVCKALVIVTSTADMRLHARWFELHHAAKLSPGMVAGVQAAAERRGGDHAALEAAIDEVVTGVNQTFHLDLRELVDRKLGSHSPRVLYASLVACAVGAAAGRTNQRLKIIEPLIGSALNGPATLQDAACTVVAGALNKASEASSRAQELPEALEEDSASTLVTLLAPALESLSPAPEWDIDRFAMHHLLGSVINAVSDDAEKCTLFAEILAPNNPFLKARTTGMVLLREAITSSEAEDNGIPGESGFHLQVMPDLVYAPRVKRLSASTDTHGVASSDTDLALLLRMDLDELWLAPDRQDDLSLFCTWTIEALKIIYTLIEQGRLTLDPAKTKHFSNVRSAVNRWRTALDDRAALQRDTTTNNDLFMNAELTLFSLDLALTRINM